MRLPRFRLRTLMIAVAAVAVALGGVRPRQMSELYGQRAYRHALPVFHFTGLGYGPAANDLMRTRLIRGHPRLVYHEAMRAQYERAARYPWLPVPPDPPPPK